nr:MAG TPA: hypothetical protein [Microviridae sp.]
MLHAAVVIVIILNISISFGTALWLLRLFV